MISFEQKIQEIITFTVLLREVGCGYLEEQRNPKGNTPHNGVYLTYAYAPALSPANKAVFCWKYWLAL